MTPEQHEKAMQVFNEAVALAADARAAFVDEACGGDTVVKAEVDSLLAHDAGPGPELDSPALGSGFDLNRIAEPRSAEHEPPQRIGPYRILDTLGEGGMGIVYLAEQTEPVRRRVALKLIKPGMDSKDVIARFESERQALAMMSHPNVARVFDAGVGEQGRPYFVMELVEGVRITEHCDRHRLSIEQRIDLFIRVCEAVQHAHQKGIIHRDLKPGNILVEYDGGAATPKVIDFGVAKATDQRLTEKTLFTHRGQLVGTPEYMSPEQAEMSAQDIDTRSDIYSLGVLLYELLTGCRPYDSQSLREAGLAGIARTIRESEPPKPSTRLSCLFASEADTVMTSATSRRADVRSLMRRVRGDLDWIVMKCLEKDRGRRYETPHALAEELRRHLHSEPVLAGPPSATYRLRKFVERNRGSVLAGAVVALGLVVSAVGITVGWIKADRSATRLTNTLGFITDDLLAPVERAERILTLSEMLNRAKGRVSERFNAEPTAEATIWRVFGLNYLGIGEMENAVTAFRESLDLREATFGEASTEAMEVRQDLAKVLDHLDYREEAAALCRKSLDLQLAAHGEEHLNTAWAQNDLGVHHLNRGQFDAAEPLLRRALKIRRSHYGEEHRNTIGTMNNLATALLGQDRNAEAASLFRQTVKAYDLDPGEDDPFTIKMLNNLGYALQNTEPSEAEPVFRECLDRQLRVLGEDDWGVFVTNIHLAYTSLAQEKFSEAEVFFREGVEYLKRNKPRDYQLLSTHLGNLAATLRWQEKWAEAEQVLREVINLQRGLLPVNESAIAGAQYWLAHVLVEQGKAVEAESVIRASLEIRTAAGAERDVIAATNSVLGECLAAMGGYEKAEELLLSAYEDVSGDLQESDSPKRRTHKRVIGLYKAWGKAGKAAEWRARLPLMEADEEEAASSNEG